MLATLVIATLAGCAPNGVQAPYTAYVVAPSSVKISWDEAFNGLDDGIGAIMFGDFYVYDSDVTGPLNNVKLEVTSGTGGVCLVPAEALQNVDYPTMPDGASMADCVDENGNFDNATNEWCGWNYDTITDQYFQFGAGYSSAGGYCPNYQTGVTDRYGMLRVYVYIDALVASDVDEKGLATGFSNAQVVGSTGYAADFFEVGPGENN